MRPPPIPAWDALHPLVVHFPLALLLTLPVLILLGLFLPRLAKPLSLAALVLMVIGAASLLLALSTGEAAEHIVTETAPIEAALEEHEELAELARNLFLVLTAIFAGLMLAAWRMGDRFSPRAFRIAAAIFLLPYAAAMLVLANVGHTGGRLVHELGVRASPAAAAPALPPAHDDD